MTTAVEVTPGRATAQRDALEQATLDLTRRITSQFLAQAEVAALNHLARQDALVADGAEDAAFTPALLEELWVTLAQAALEANLGAVLGALPPGMRKRALLAYNAHRVASFFDMSVTDLAYDVANAIFTRARTEGLSNRQAGRLIARAFSLNPEGPDISDIPAGDIPTLLRPTSETVAKMAVHPEQAADAFDWRARRMARTASTQAYNSAMLEQIREDGYDLKLWVSHHDDRVRESHQRADGVAIPLDQEFRVGEGTLLYPGDPTAPIGEVINCRCVLVGEMGAATEGIDWDQPVIPLSDRIAQGLEPPLYPTLDELVASAATMDWAFNPAQARVPKGRPDGGQWAESPSGLVERLETHYQETGINLFGLQKPPTSAADFAPLIEHVQDLVAKSNPPAGTSINQEVGYSLSAYQADAVHDSVSQYLRAGKEPPAIDTTDSFFEPGTFDERPVKYRLNDYYATKHDEDSYDERLTEGVIRTMDSALGATRTQAPSRVFRGIAADPDGDFSKGSVWYDDSYSSTSADAHHAQMFADTRVGKSTPISHHVTRAPEGGTPLVMEMILDAGIGYAVGATAVGEIILERGLRYEVLREDEGGGHILVGVTRPEAS